MSWFLGSLMTMSIGIWRERIDKVKSPVTVDVI